MLKVNKVIGRHYDLTRSSGSRSEPQAGKTDIQYSGDLPLVVLKYSDATRATLLYTTNITWDNGVPTEVETLNHSNGLTATTTLEWVNGKLVSIDKVTA